VHSGVPDQIRRFLELLVAVAADVPPDVVHLPLHHQVPPDGAVEEGLGQPDVARAGHVAALFDLVQDLLVLFRDLLLDGSHVRRDRGLLLQLFQAAHHGGDVPQVFVVGVGLGDVDVQRGHLLEYASAVGTLVHFHAGDGGRVGLLDVHAQVALLVKPRRAEGAVEGFGAGVLGQVDLEGALLVETPVAVFALENYSLIGLSGDVRDCLQRMASPHCVSEGVFLATKLEKNS
jgi:hypothetical protein